MIHSTASLCVSALLAMSLARHGAHSTHHAVKAAPPAGKIAPWDAMKIAEKKTGGKALSATFEYDDGHWIYGVMVVSKGHLKEVEIDPKTGKIGEVEEGTPAGEAKELEHDLAQALKG